MKHLKRKQIRKFRKVLTTWERIIMDALRKEPALKIIHVTD